MSCRDSCPDRGRMQAPVGHPVGQPVRRLGPCHRWCAVLFPGPVVHHRSSVVLRRPVVARRPHGVSSRTCLLLLIAGHHSSVRFPIWRFAAPQAAAHRARPARARGARRCGAPVPAGAAGRLAGACSPALSSGPGLVLSARSVGAGRAARLSSASLSLDRACWRWRRRHDCTPWAGWANPLSRTSLLHQTWLGRFLVL